MARPLDEVRAALAANRASDLLLPMDTGLDFPEVTLDAAEMVHFARGQQLRHDAAKSGEGLVRVLDSAGRLAAIGRMSAGVLAPEKVFAA
jgi:hypothetical protein